MKRIVLLCVLMFSPAVHAEIIPESAWSALCDSILANNRLIRSGSGSLVYEYVLQDSLREREQIEKMIDARMANQTPRENYSALPDSLRPYSPPIERPRPMVKLVTHVNNLYKHSFVADQTVEGYFFVMPARLEVINLLNEQPSVAKHIYAWDGTYMQRLVYNKTSDGSILLDGFKNQPRAQIEDVAEYNMLYYVNGVFEMAVHSQIFPGGITKISGFSEDIVDGEIHLIIEVITTHPEHPGYSRQDTFTFLPEKQFRPINIETETIDASEEYQGELVHISISYQKMDGILIPKRIETQQETIIDGKNVLHLTRTLDFQDDWVINGNIDPAVFTMEFPEEARVRDYSSGQ